MRRIGPDNARLRAIWGDGMTWETIPQVITWPVAAVIIAILLLPVLLSVLSTINKNIGKAVEGLKNLNKASDALARLPEQLDRLKETSAEIRSLSDQVRSLQETARAIDRRTETIADLGVKARLESDWSALFDLLAEKAPPGADFDRRSASALVRLLDIPTELAKRVEDVFSEIKSIRRTWDADPRDAEQRAQKAIDEIAAITAQIERTA